MRLLAVGTGDAFSAVRYSTCLAVESDGTWLLVDCPHPVRKMLREASTRAGLALDVGDVAGVVLSHLHADHASGLEDLAYMLHFGFGRRLPLLVHPDVLARLWDGHLAAGMEQILPSLDAAIVRKRLDDWFDVVPLDLARATQFGPFAVECRRTIHHIPTTAFRIRAGARTLGVSADTAFDESLIAWLAEADLFVHETNHGIHTPYAKLAALDGKTRAKMRLVHYPDELPLEGLAIEALREGQLLDV